MNTNRQTTLSGDPGISFSAAQKYAAQSKNREATRPTRKEPLPDMDTRGDFAGETELS